MSQLFHVKQFSQVQPHVVFESEPSITLMPDQLPYRIDIFLSDLIIEATAGSLASALQKVHFKTLCEQYGLAPDGIQEVLSHLAVLGSPVSADKPFFAVKYGVKVHQTLVIDLWNTAKSDGRALLEDVLSAVDDTQIQKELENTVRILSIALNQQHLRDMGRLLAYETARWAGFHGKGMVRGLDGLWYRLNQHQAFIPFH